MPVLAVFLQSLSRPRTSPAHERLQTAFGQTGGSRLTSLPTANIQHDKCCQYRRGIFLQYCSSTLVQMKRYWNHRLMHAHTLKEDSLDNPNYACIIWSTKAQSIISSTAAISLERAHIYKQKPSCYKHTCALLLPSYFHRTLYYHCIVLCCEWHDTRHIALIKAMAFIRRLCSFFSSLCWLWSLGSSVIWHLCFFLPQILAG